MRSLKPLGLTLMLFTSMASAKVELVQPKVASGSEGLFMRGLIRGKAEPGAKIAVDTTSSLVVDVNYKSESLNLPGTLKAFSQEYFKSVQKFSEGLYLIRPKCKGRAKPSSKSKLIKVFKPGELAWVREHSKALVKVVEGDSDFYIAKKCLISPKQKRPPRVRSVARVNPKGLFKMVLELPEGNVQLILTESLRGQTKKQLFNFNVTRTAVYSETPFVSIKELKAKAALEAKEAKKAAEKAKETSGGGAYFSANLGLGVNLLNFEQQVNEDQNISFNTTSSPNISLGLVYRFESWGARIRYNQVSSELKEAEAPYSLASEEFDVGSYELLGDYFFQAKNYERGRSFSFGYKSVKVPILLVDAVSAVTAQEDDIGAIYLGYNSRNFEKSSISFPWSVGLLVPMSDGDYTSGNYGAQIQLGMVNYFGGSWFTELMGQLDYIDSDFAYNLSGFTRSGSTVLTNVYIDFNLGYTF